MPVIFGALVVGWLWMCCATSHDKQQRRHMLLAGSAAFALGNIFQIWMAMP